MEKRIDDLTSNREEFNAFVYTPLNEAVRQLGFRQKNEELKKYLDKNLNIELPPNFKKGSLAFLSRQIVSPNYETRRFISIIESIEDLTPVFWEYNNDKFFPQLNKSKHALGKLGIFFGRNRNNENVVQFCRVVDFSLYEGKKLSEIKTIWGQDLTEFHHELFDEIKDKIDEVQFFDASEWYKKLGGKVGIYYKHLLQLFLQHGILFENFMLNDEECTFTKNIFLPAFMEIYKETGVKPLIVALEPTDIEGEDFWHQYPVTILENSELKKLI